jgi:hypothetical protein
LVVAELPALKSKPSENSHRQIYGRLSAEVQTSWRGLKAVKALARATAVGSSHLPPKQPEKSAVVAAEERPMAVLVSGVEERRSAAVVAAERGSGATVV